MENNDHEVDNETEQTASENITLKRPRGRPRVEKPPKEIKKIGRPRTRPIPDPDAPKRGRGAPQKDNSEKKTVDIVQYRKNYYKMLKKMDQVLKPI